MKKIYVFLCSVLLIFVLTLVGCSQEEKVDKESSSTGSEQTNKELTVTSFGGSYDEVFTKYIIEPFEKEHPGVTVKLAPYTGVAKLSQGGGANVDIVQLDDFDLIDAGNQGFLTKLEEKNFNNWSSLYPEAILKSQDKEVYGLVNVFGSWGIAYNPEKVEKPTSWNDFLNKGNAGKTTLMGQWIPDMLMLAAATDGTTENMDSVWEAYEKITPLVAQYYSSFSAPESLFGTGEVNMASWFDGRAYALKEAGNSIDFVIPKEGGVLIRSGMGIVADSKNKELAQELIDFSMSIEVQKGFANDLFYGPTNKTVELDEKLQGNVVYGEDEISNLLAPDWNEILPKREEWLLKWTEVTSQ